MWWYGGNSRHLPEATGPYLPGCTDVMLGYGPTSLLMRLYYPTNANKNPGNFCRWITWMPEGTGYIEGLAKVLFAPVFIIRFFLWWSSRDIPVLYGVRPKTDQKLKCIVLSHGLGAHRSLYNHTCCEFASRGYLVAVVEHKGGSACYSYYYNSKEEAQNDVKTDVKYIPFKLGKAHFKLRKKQVTERAEECNRVLDFLLTLNQGIVPHNVIDEVPTLKAEFKLSDLVNKLDLETLTMAGHSFGGSTALLTLSQRSEFKQGVLLDPWMYPIKDLDLDEKITQPLIFINTQTFHIDTNVKSMSKFLKNDTVMYTLLGTTHEHQTDTVVLFGSWLNWFMKKTDPLTVLKINNSLILEFLSAKTGVVDIDECKETLEEESHNYEKGLTKPWA